MVFERRLPFDSTWKEYDGGHHSFFEQNKDKLDIQNYTSKVIRVIKGTALELLSRTSYFSTLSTASSAP